MALNKWQKREVAQHAQDNGISEEAALKDLYPEEAEAPARRRPAAKAEKDPEPAKA